jgi:hypothetical protein
MENAMDPAHTAFLHTIVSGSQFTEEFGIRAQMGPIYFLPHQTVTTSMACGGELAVSVI